MIYIKHFIFACAIIGALNWGIIGLFDFNIISYVLGAESLMCKAVYIYIGACAIFSATFAVIDCKCHCEMIAHKNFKPEDN